MAKQAKEMEEVGKGAIKQHKKEHKVIGSKEAPMTRKPERKHAGRRR